MLAAPPPAGAVVAPRSERVAARDSETGAEAAARPASARRDQPPAGTAPRVATTLPARPADGQVPVPSFQPGAADADRNGCTAPQLRRFIKSRAYVPMHELRRRFAIEGSDDDVTPVEMDRGVRVFVGLPNREGRLLGDLLRSGDIGYELSFDPIAPIVVGVFPMRPVPRA
jgi:hypothetical protein